jgi:3'-5' exoribonuclease
MSDYLATDHVDLRSLGDRTFVEGVYGIVNPQLAETRQGKPFLKCLLRDASGEMPGRMWNCEDAVFARFASAPFVRVRGTTQSYNDSVQMILESVEPVDPSPAELARLVPMSKRDLDEMFAQVSAILRSTRHPGIRALLEAYLADETIMLGFCRAPAATSLHHAYIGGLLEHTLQLLTLAEAMLPHYPELNRDLVLAGLFLHDLGKTSELEWERGFNYTVRGNLVGHVIDGALMLRSKFAAIRTAGGEMLPPAAQTVLEHIVVSHHGQLEFGAAKLPSTPEAIFVAMLDNLDAKTAMALSNARRADWGTPGDHGSEFSERVWALDTRIYRPDPLAE